MHGIKINILFLAKERLERQIFSVVPSVLYFLFVQPAHERARAKRACALRALGLLLADGALTVGRRRTF